MIYTGPGKKPISRKCVLLIPYYGDFSSNKELIFRKCVLLAYMPFGANNLKGNLYLGSVFYLFTWPLAPIILLSILYLESVFYWFPSSGVYNITKYPIFRKCVLLVPVLWSLAIFIVAPLALDKRLHRSHNNHILSDDKKHVFWFITQI